MDTKNTKTLEEIVREGFTGDTEVLFPDGSIYKGNFENGRVIGDTLTFSDGSIYVGGLNENRQMEGKGKLTFRNGGVYEGEFENGERIGKGRYTVGKPETKETLYTQVYKENGMIEAVEYNFEYNDGNEKKKIKIVIDYDRINRGLNEGKINDLEDLIKKNT